MPLFSVVIPLFNKEDYIKSTIQSVLNQSLKDFELIVVNDGSTDNSFKLAKECIQGLSNCRIIDQNNQGLSASRNRGIKESKGDLVAFLDADDLWNSEFLKTINDLYINFPDASLYGTGYLEKFHDKVILEPKKNINHELKNKAFLIEDFFDANLFQPIVCQSSFAAKKMVFKELSYNETINLSEDIDFYIKSNLKYKFAYSYKNLATVLLNIPDQITKSGIAEKTIPNFDLYEQEALKNQSLKKYLDFYRYTFAIQYKLEKDIDNFKLLVNKIALNNLNSKQKFLLKSPLFVLRKLKVFKNYMLKKKIRMTSF